MSLSKLRRVVLLIPYFISSFVFAQSVRLDSLKDQLRQVDDPELQIQQMNAIAVAYVGLDVDSAIHYLGDAVDLASRIENDSLYHISNVYLSIFKIENGDTLGVYRNLANAIQYQKQTGQIGFLTVTYNTLGNYFIKIGDRVKALGAYQQAIDYEEQRGNGHGMAISEFNLSLLLIKMGRSEEAYQKMHNVLNQLYVYGDTSSTLRIFVTFTEMFIANDSLRNPLYNLDSAVIYGQKALRIAEKMNFRIGVIKSHQALIPAYLLAGECEKAQEAITVLQQIGQTELLDREKTMLQIQEAKVLLCLNESEAAIQKVLGLEVKGERALERLKILCDAYEMSNQPGLSLKFHKKASSLKDSLDLSSLTTQLAELQTQYETEKKDNEIASLSQQAQIQALEIKQRNLMLAGLGVVLLLLIGGGVFYYQWRNLRYQQSVAGMEQRMLRLQMNPHFIFNALAAIQSYIIQSNTRESISYLAKFGKLMRQILEHSREEFISINEEADMLRNYLEIQQLRFKNSFVFDINIDENLDASSTHIPPMFAQPFVENAIEHGLKDKDQNGRIFIRFHQQGNTVILEVEDNGRGFDANAESGNHKSLATVITKERLSIFEKQFKDAFGVTVAKITKGTLVKLVLPVKY